MKADPIEYGAPTCNTQRHSPGKSRESLDLMLIQSGLDCLGVGQLVSLRVFVDVYIKSRNQVFNPTISFTFFQTLPLFLGLFCYLLVVQSLSFHIYLPHRCSNTIPDSSHPLSIQRHIRNRPDHHSLLQFSHFNQFQSQNVSPLRCPRRNLPTIPPLPSLLPNRHNRHDSQIHQRNNKQQRHTPKHPNRNDQRGKSKSPPT